MVAYPCARLTDVPPRGRTGSAATLRFSLRAFDALDPANRPTRHAAARQLSSHRSKAPKIVQQPPRSQNEEGQGATPVAGDNAVRPRRIRAAMERLFPGRGDQKGKLGSGTIVCPHILVLDVAQYLVP